MATAAGTPHDAGGQGAWTASAPPPDPGRTRVPPLGMAVAAAALCGVGLCCVAPAFPGRAVALSLLVLGLAGACVPGKARLAGALLLGFAWTALQGGLGLAAQLPPALEGRDLVIEGQLVDLPVHEARRTRFRFRAARGSEVPESLRGRLLQLNWYLPRHALDEAAAERARRRLLPGSRWRLPVRLRAPRGLRNPGAGDGERQALAARLVATGYVREPDAARRLSVADGLDAWRGRLADAIEAAVDRPGARFIRALAIGDTRGLDDDDWATLRAVGLTHLVAISGFHVGIVGSAFALAAVALWQLMPGLGRRLPRPQAAALAALAGAGLYAAASGGGLPTLRTLLMIAAVVAARLLRRRQRGADALALALLAVLAADPLSVLAPGFWLSFAGVAWLLWCLPQTGDRGWRPAARAFLLAQAVATLGLLPLGIALFGQASLAGPLANLVAIPWWSLVVVPLSLAGTALEALHPGWGGPCWRLAALLFDPSWALFERLGASPLALSWLPRAPWPAIPLALASAFWCLLPRGLPGRGLALLLWLPLLWPPRGLPPPGAVALQVVDVGQGLSVLVRTAGHVLLYDMGPAEPDGFDAGARAVVPTLRALGVRALDAAVVSHGDNDHAGGYAAVAREFPMPVAWSPAGAPPLPAARACEAGRAWTWDGVRFRFLHPPPLLPYLKNQSSCVLRIETVGGAALLTGDIDHVVEAALARRQPEALRADVVLVAHHGSAGSSEPAFVAATRARWALVSVGHGNRFHHPAREVMARWREAGARTATTAGLGALSVRLGAGPVQVVGERQAHRRPWDAAARQGAGAGLSYRPD